MVLYFTMFGGMKNAQGTFLCYDGSFRDLGRLVTWVIL
jgi:hypothetical protein